MLCTDRAIDWRPAPAPPPLVPAVCGHCAVAHLIIAHNYPDQAQRHWAISQGRPAVSVQAVQCSDTPLHALCIVQVSIRITR